MSQSGNHEKADVGNSVVGSIYDLLRTQCRKFANNDLLVVPEAVCKLWGLQQGSWTYSQTFEIAEQLAAGYRSAGFGPGHRVALVLENRPVFFFHWLALNAVGASAVPVNPDYTTDEMSFVFGHSESSLVVCLPARLRQASDAARGLGIAVVADDVTDFPVAPADQLQHAPESDARECALVYTSGTTGQPKGCLLSNAYFFGWAEWYSAQGGLITLREGLERLMTPLPAFHVNAIGHSFMGMLGTGGAQIIVDRFHPRSWWQTATETKATCFHYLGVMPAILLELPHSDVERAHSLRFGVGGGVHPEHHEVFERRFGVPLLEGWAMTETGAAGLLCASEDPRHVGERCLGHPDRPGPAMEVRLLSEGGGNASPGTPGELVLRAIGSDRRRGFFSGYLKDDAATNEVWSGGWLHTGDILRQDVDGNLYFVDRKKNIIRRSGENIAAAEVEAVIMNHGRVAKVAVVAVADPIRGEEVLAAIVPTSGNPGQELAADIFDHCAQHLAYFKLPGYVAFLEELPVTSTQKVRKSDLGSLTQDPQSHPDCIDMRGEKQALRNIAS